MYQPDGLQSETTVHTSQLHPKKPCVDQLVAHAIVDTHSSNHAIRHGLNIHHGSPFSLILRNGIQAKNSALTKCTGLRHSSLKSKPS